MPLHLGMLADYALPPAMRFADRAFGTAWMIHPSRPLLISWARLGAARRSAGRRPAGTPAPTPPLAIIRRPRVEAGHVVLRRARWAVPAGWVPARARGESDADFLLRLAAWLRRQSVPGRIFVRGWAHDDFGEKVSKAHKPVYFDVANPWLVAEFERRAAAFDFLIFEEALPDPGEALGGRRDGATGDAWVTEFLVEISDAQGGHG